MNQGTAGKAATHQAVTGSRPEGATSEGDASRRVQEMFTRIAPRYDLLNHLLSLELDRVWRARTARLLSPILQRADAQVLDLCCGTGDLTFALQRRGPARLWGADFAHPMLVRAREKAAHGSAATSAQPVFIESDALHLPFADGTFDLVTTGFGFRNLANYAQGLQEIRRVLKPGGTLAILECTEPRPGWFGDLYRWYFRTVLPWIGGWISGDRMAYKYLPRSVQRFLHADELKALMRENGYGQVEARLWTGGTIALHTGTRTQGN
ncbi:MAG TPA: bifunctional demethylmenaquinone methyltransferase/2-methoxy-6-polyprenyl-1,4-benzoquinol methylase UbiE [Dongiaceae bacterium]|nr:bifunctional demethylmenaquinone methyltransferase/2-methoxy-6-polyprenyl-1,4-benzoquinol methylase UbiE [Dongiaceae bacterium]